MNIEISIYNDNQKWDDKEICEQLMKIIDTQLPEAEKKIWHAHPVWFLDGNPIVGYSKQKAGIKLMFWSGADFEEEKLLIRVGKFKDASTCFKNVAEIDTNDLERWLKKSKEIQWDYKNIVKRKGRLEKLNLPNREAIVNSR
jgi:uncharacterized protein YdhG (YjbR/CyaY superfamily)